MAEQSAADDVAPAAEGAGLIGSAISHALRSAIAGGFAHPMTVTENKTINRLSSLFRITDTSLRANSPGVLAAMRLGSVGTTIAKLIRGAFDHRNFGGAPTSSYLKTIYNAVLAAERETR